MLGPGETPKGKFVLRIKVNGEPTVGWQYEDGQLLKPIRLDTEGSDWKAAIAAVPQSELNQIKAEILRAQGREVPEALLAAVTEQTEEPSKNESIDELLNELYDTTAEIEERRAAPTAREAFGKRFEEEISKKAGPSP
jgi:hypothetical protein